MDDVPPPPRPPPVLYPQDLDYLATHGFLGFALPPQLAAQFEALRAAADAFFALPAETKAAYAPGASKGPPGVRRRPPGGSADATPAPMTTSERGYCRLPGEKEFLTLRRSMTHLPPGLRAAALPVWHDTARLLQRILADLAEYMDLPAGVGAWDAVVHDSLEPRGFRAGSGSPASASASKPTTEPASRPWPPLDSPLHPRNDPPTLLRMFRYEPGGGGAEQHRDLGLLTLCVCWGRGLQVQPQVQSPLPSQTQPQPPSPLPSQTQPLPPSQPSTSTNEMACSDAAATASREPPTGQDEREPPWIDAPRVTVMTGTTLHVLSGGRIPSALHRVVVDEAEARPSSSSSLDGPPDTPDHPWRRSIVFALRATTAGTIDLTTFGGEGQIGAAELYSLIRQRRVNVNVSRSEREAIRAQHWKDYPGPGPVGGDKTGNGGDAGSGNSLPADTRDNRDKEAGRGMAGVA